ncbi:MAG: hypothetical protein ACRENO_06955, partial [Thermodesulfobacteriota bacterium]
SIHHISFMKRTQIYLKEEQYDYLLKESLNKGKSIAEIIRELVDKNIYSKQKRSKDISFWEIGEDDFSTGIKDGSISHDQIIYKSKSNADES